MSETKHILTLEDERSLDKYRIVSGISKFMGFALFTIAALLGVLYSNDFRAQLPNKITTKIQIPISLRERVDERVITDSSKLWLRTDPEYIVKVPAGYVKGADNKNLNWSKLSLIDMESLPKKIEKYYVRATPTEAKIIEAQLFLLKKDSDGAKEILSQLDLNEIYGGSKMITPKLAHIFDEQLYGKPQSAYVVSYVKQVKEDWTRKSNTIGFTILFGGLFVIFSMLINKRLRKIESHFFSR